jgi:hypothetical protein
MDSAATDNEQKLAGTLAELAKAETNLAKYELAFRTPRGTVEPATRQEIAAAKRASLEASPRWKAEQKISRALIKG